MTTDLAAWRRCPPPARGATARTIPCSLRIAGLPWLVTVLFSSPGAAQDTSSVVANDTSIAQPTLITPPHPRYPESLRRLATQGDVVVDVMVDTLGRPEPRSLRIIRSDDERFNEEARRAALGARFRPGTIGNRPARLPVRMRISFTLRWEEWLPRECRGRPLPRPPDRSPEALDSLQLREIHDEVRPDRLYTPPLGYPESLRRAGVEGSVLVEVVLDTRGCVETQTLRALRATDPRFVPPAFALVVASRFSPGVVNGRAVRVRVQVPVNFGLAP